MRLTRSRDDVVVSGVLAGLGEYFNIDPTLLRIGFVILTFFGVGTVIPIYIVASIIIPKEPIESRSDRKKSAKEKRKKMNRQNRFERRNQRRHRRNNYDTIDPDNNSSSKVKDIDEDDWSDF